MQKTILFMDNTESFLIPYTLLLQKEGYHVVQATTVAEAEDRLNQHHIHAAIFDIRMEEENDEQDINGLALAQKQAYRSIPKIMLTGFPSFEHARKALGISGYGHSPAVKFLAKDDGPQAVIDAVHWVFEEYVRLNWDLKIEWYQPNQLAIHHLTALVEPTIQPNRLDLHSRALEDLFRKLFFDYQQITIKYLATPRPGLVALAVFAYQAKRPERQFIVVCGQKLLVSNEARSYENYGPQLVSEGGIVKDKTVEMTRFAATAYTLTGSGSLEQVGTFAEFYRSNTAETVAKSLDDFLSSILTPWHRQGQFSQQKSLNIFRSTWPALWSDDAGPEKLQSRIKAICQAALGKGLVRLESSPHQVKFQPAGEAHHVYTNPIACLSEAQLAPDKPVIYATIHGNLHSETILTDRQGKTWLTDFSKTSEGPLLYDLVSLEAMIKFELLASVSVEARYEMETRLAKIAALDDAIDVSGLSSEIQKAIQAIAAIRRHAVKYHNPSKDSYLLSLLLGALNNLVTFPVEVRLTAYKLAPYVHSLLSAAILYQELTRIPDSNLPEQARYSLWLDAPNKIVWVEGRNVELSTQEFDIVALLYQQAGQLCTRETMAKEVFGVIFDNDLTLAQKRRIEEGRINSAMSRLRRKIEPNPEYTKYITLVRGQGYRLDLGAYNKPNGKSKATRQADASAEPPQS